MFQLSKPLILASNSPRRKQLMHDSGFDFEVEVLPTDETYPETLESRMVAAHISGQKAEVFRGLHPDKIILTSDTVVIVDGEILGKPKDAADAARMLNLLSDRTHEVVTAVSLLSGNEITTKSDVAFVSFRKLDELEINHYIEHYKPFDKAGAYGIQEWISMIGITRIEGSFYTIMGLPVHVVHDMLRPFFIDQQPIR
jgi:septum formation protein